MQVKHDDLVRISKETELFVRHLDRSMVNLSHILDAVLQFACVEFDLRVGHRDRLEGICLRRQRLFLVLEVIDSIGQVRSFDLLASVIVDFCASLIDVLLAETYQAQMLLKVLLLAHDTCLFDRQCLSVF